MVFSSKILDLEKKLLESNVRKNANEISRYLEKDFFEFTSKGKIYKYSDGDIFYKEGDDNIKYDILDYSVTELSDFVVLMTYQIRKTNIETNISELSLRSSIWRRHKSEWKILFHQGTLIPSEGDSNL